MEEKKTPFVPDFLKGADKTFLPEWLRKSGVGKLSAANSVPVSKPIILKEGHCIIPRKGIFPLDVKIQDGKIHSMGENLSDSQSEIIYLGGEWILPGVVDPHVHLGIFADFETEIVTETRSALLNGVTTIGLYLGGQESYLPVLDEIIEKIQRHSWCDVFIHLVILNRKQLEEVPVYASRYGIRSFKTYLCGIPGLIPEVEDDFLLDLMEKVASLGDDAVLNIHAENHRIVSRATEGLKKTDPFMDSLAQWEKTHPALAETEAIQRAALLSKASGAKIYFVHLSSGQSVRLARELRKKHKHLLFETTSPYLTLDLEEEIDFRYKMVPPIRSGEDRQSLWEGLAEDIIDTIGSDHTPMSMAEKKRSVNLWHVPPGYPAVGTHLPSLLDRAGKYRFPLNHLVEKLTLSPAEIFGLHPRKGNLFPGTDADLVIVDPTLRKEVTPETAASRSDYCLHQGKMLTGWPVAVIKGGRFISSDSPEKAEPPVKGRYLRRG
jgi:dihydropyrimidinase